MIRYPPRVFPVLAFALLAVAGVLLWRAWPSESWEARPGYALEYRTWWLDALMLLWLGRLALSWLPAGQVGAHSWSELPLTIAASLLLGPLAALPADLGALATATDARWWRLGLALLASAIAYAVHPRALVPRHAPVPDRWTWFERGLVVALAGAAVAIAWRRSHLGQQLFPGYTAHLWIQAITCALGIAHGLRCAGLARSGSLCIAMIALLTPGFAFGRGEPYLCGIVALACGFAIAWFERADARALWLSAIAFATLVLNSQRMPQGWFGIAGLVALVLATHANARTRALAASVAGLALVALAPWITGGLRQLEFAEQYRQVALPSRAAWQAWLASSWDPARHGLWSLLVLLCALLLAGRWFLRDAPVLGRLWSEREATRSIGVLAALLVAGLALPLFELPQFERESAHLLLEESLLPLLPLCALFAGLVLAPQTRPTPELSPPLEAPARG